MGASIWQNEKFMQVLRGMGYTLNERGFLKCIEKELGRMTLMDLSRKLNVSKDTLLGRMRKNGIKNPNTSGGNNNPGGYYGKMGRRTDSKDYGVRKKED